MYANLNRLFLSRSTLSFSKLKKLFYSSKNLTESTIFALSSGYGKCGVAVIRISGPQSKQVLKEMAGFKSLPVPRLANLRKLRDPRSNEVLDNGLVLWFPGPRSFTGEDCCELQIHGGPAVISAVVESLGRIDHMRPALPGEFTKRAFYAGKLDLTEVEGLADLIHAETEAQRRQALRQMEGSLSKLYQSWADVITECVAHIEAYIDFSEEENLDESLFSEVKSQISKLHDSVEKHLNDGHKGERLRGGVNAIIIGAPNAGKSSLLNILSGHDSAIVSPIAGTTRDIIKSTIDVGGFPMTVHDTAGLRPIDLAADSVEREGISRAVKAAQKADLIILVVDSTALPDLKPRSPSLEEHIKGLGVFDLVSRCHNVESLFGNTDSEKTNEGGPACFVLFNKIDLMEGPAVQGRSEFEFGISCKTQQGVDEFIRSLSKTLEYLCGRPGQGDPRWTQARHKHSIESLLKDLGAFLHHTEPDIMAHHLRRSLYHIGTITGHVSNNQILDIIFKQFCIGK